MSFFLVCFHCYPNDHRFFFSVRYPALRCYGNNSALAWAAGSGHADIVTHMVGDGAVPVPWLIPAVAGAVAAGHLECLQLLLGAKTAGNVEEVRTGRVPVGS